MDVVVEAVELMIMVVLLPLVVLVELVCTLVDEVVEMEVMHKMVLVQQHLED